MWHRTTRTSRRPTARPSRRRYAWYAVVLAAVGAVGSTWLWNSEAPEAAAESIVMWQSPTHDCCTKWAAYMERKGYRVTTHYVGDLVPVKQRFGIPETLQSCHTAVVAGYLVEGHVPAGAVAKLLDEQPALRGIALPGMPAGPPGMGGSPGLYRVVGFTADEHVSRFAGFGP